MKSFKILLDEFDQVLKQHNLPNYNKLKSPLPRNEIDNLFSNLNLNNSELHLLYEWKDGFFRVKGHCEILKFGYFLPLESINNTINYFSNEIGPAIEQFSETMFWKSAYIPITEDFDDATLFFNNNPGVDQGKIFLFSPSLMFVDPVSYYDSVYCMIETTSECYKQGVFKYEPENDILNMDIDRYFELAESINVNSNYWKTKNH